MKEHKQYSNIVVVISLVVFLMLGAYTWTPVSQVQYRAMTQRIYTEIQLLRRKRNQLSNLAGSLASALWRGIHPPDLNIFKCLNPGGECLSTAHLLSFLPGC